MLKLRLNPTLDQDALAATYKDHQRLHITDFFEPDIATDIATALEAETAWVLTYNKLDVSYDVPAETLASLTQAEYNDILIEIYSQAASQFQYLFEKISVTDNTTLTALHEVADFLNSPACLHTLRHITSQSAIEFADAQATRYGAGHFLKHHTDHAPSEHRIAAYVLNFSRDWSADDGGQLQFIGPNNEVTAAYAPRLGALNIFAVPQPHAVSFIPPYCTAKRHSITGWLRTHS